jgi:CBS domain containing-hemolysin-like protein
VAATVLSGFFSLTGFALRSFRRTLLEETFKGPRAPKRLKVLERQLKPLRLTTALCCALANLILVVAMVMLFDQPITFWGTVGAVLSGGAIIAVFGVAIPHAWALHGGEKVLAATLELLVFFRYTLYPVITLMQGFDVPIRRLSGVSDEEAENGDNAKQEILQAATEGQAEGTVEPEEVQMIESVMEFGETHTGEIMTPRTDIFALPVDTPWAEAIERVVEAGHTRVPVYEGDLDNIIGVLYAKDMLKHTSSDKPPELRKLMRSCYVVPETKPLDDLLKEFKTRKVHLAVVLDEYGGTAGIVTIEDVVEEIVGDIADEYDLTAPEPLNRVDERNAEVDGRFHIDELNDAFELELPEDEDYDTVAGFVFSELGYIPAVGETLEAHGAKFTVLKADDRKITRIHVELPRHKKTKGAD